MSSRADSHAELTDITVRFPENGVTANDGVTLDISCGEVHALVGENGSGKSTLMHVLSGYVRKDEGTIRIAGHEADIRSPRQALELGVGMVHQHLRLVRRMQVWENVVLGAEPTGLLGALRRREAITRLRKISRDYGFDIDPRRYAGELGTEGMERVALLTVLYHGADLIVLDEPTAELDEISFGNGEEESTSFSATSSLIERLTREGKTVVLITHKLRDALAVADRITVMREGRAVSTAPASTFTIDSLGSLMIGGEYVPRPRKRSARTEGENGRSQGETVPGETVPGEALPGETVLQMEEISCVESGYAPIRNMSLSVRSGEVVAVTGIRENGLETLEHLLAGLTSPDSGILRYSGEELKTFSSSELRRKDIAYIPTERLVRGASMESSVAENMILLNYHDFHSWGRLKRDEIEHYTGRLSREYGIKGKPGQPLSGLSGGNIQKVIISRELEMLPKLVIFSEPSWGLDTRSRNFVAGKIDLLAARGSAVLVLTSDLDEALEMGDAVLALYRGRTVGRLEGEEAVKSRLGRMVLGLDTGEKGGDQD